MLIISAILSIRLEIFRVRRTIYHRYFKLNLVDNEKIFHRKTVPSFSKKGKSIQFQYYTLRKVLLIVS